MDDEWLIIHTPGGVYCWDLGAPADDEREDLVNRARVLASVPAQDVWPGDGTGYVIMLSYGEPHATLLARATVGTVGDLAAVDVAAVEAHQAGRDELARQERLAGATAALDALSADDRAVFLANASAPPQEAA